MIKGSIQASYRQSYWPLWSDWDTDTFYTEKEGTLVSQNVASVTCTRPQSRGACYTGRSWSSTSDVWTPGSEDGRRNFTHFPGDDFWETQWTRWTFKSLQTLNYEKVYRQLKPRLSREMAGVYYKWIAELIILLQMKCLFFPILENPYPVVFFPSINFHVLSILRLFQ